MEYRTLGRSGLQVSAISLGSWITFGQSVDDEATAACMHAAYDNGVNFFDGAEAYGRGRAELAMGRVFQQAGWDRDTLVISTKVIAYGDAPTQRGVSRKHLVEAVDAALQRMGLDYVDLCFCHRPDGVTPAEEIVHTMNQLITRGKILYWGTSEFSPFQLQEICTFAERHGLVGPTMEQTNHSMLNRRRVDGELAPLFERYGLGTTIYSPLAQGVLTGKYNGGVPARARLDPEKDRRVLSEENIAKARRLAEVAAELGISMAQLALAWCLKNPHVSTAIIGATRREQVEDNVQAVDAVGKLDDAVMARIERILDNRPD
ncbi:MAG: aldo/keto reductase [Alphaproteobacteria bacterium]|jgi:voltage-dependent potassium channel beta subunit|nr:aldo/keto reductase [Alphaproteobacteria bacterium]